MQVGKIYTHPADGNSIQYECVKILPDNKAVIIWVGSKTYCSSIISRLDTYQEYKEPRKGICWVNVYENGQLCAHSSKERADKYSNYKNRIALVEIPWVEGQGIKCNCTAAGGQPCGKKGCDQ